tara:strand:- start:13 stop:444 length:432 start_codon:yes stop_codon:yes gene_type:complete
MSLPLNKIKEIINKHSELEKELSKSNLDSKSFAKKSKEYSNLNDIIKNANEYLDFDQNKKDLEKILNETSSDKEIKDLAKTEIDELDKKHKKNEILLKLFMLPKDEADTKNAILEIRAGTGGLEASLFASDLFKMYEKVCNKK